MRKQLLSSPHKLLYPENNITKLHLAHYYESIQDWILPYIVKRPLTLVRCPDGYQAECFYQKHLNESIAQLHSVNIIEKNKTEPYCYISDLYGLLSLVQLSTLEIHTWNCQITDIEKPDMLIFDLDPAPEVAWKNVVKAAHYVKEMLENIELRSFVKTTGGKGLHIVVPVQKQHAWEPLKNFTHHIVKALVAANPNEFIGVMTKAKRTGKIYIDYLRNQRGSTSIAPYSTRALKHAPVATPLRWEELTTKIKPDTFTVSNIAKRLSGLKTDPWEDFFNIKQSVKLEG